MEDSQGRNNICLLGISEEENQNSWKELISENIIQEKTFGDRPKSLWNYISEPGKINYYLSCNYHLVYICNKIFISKIISILKIIQNWTTENRSSYIQLTFETMWMLRVLTLTQLKIWVTHSTLYPQFWHLQINRLYSITVVFIEKKSV